MTEIPSTNDHISTVARELSIKTTQVSAALELLDSGATIPFISRYRKEATGGLDEVQLGAVRDNIAQLRALDARKEAVLASLTERELLTDALQAAIQGAKNLCALEDMYLPYRPKRRTRAKMAEERGLAPLSKRLQELIKKENPQSLAAEFIKKTPPNADKETLALAVPDADAALAGARDIIAEQLSENATVREKLRAIFARTGRITSSVIAKNAEDGAKFRDWFDWSEDANKAAGHRILAMLRGAEEGVLRVQLRPNERGEDEAKRDLLRALLGEQVNKMSPAAISAALRDENTQIGQLFLAEEDAWKRLLLPSLENDALHAAKARADAQAIAVFAANLRELLLAPPLGQARVLALDPGFRTGCKLVCLDAQGALLHHTAIFPHTGGARAEEAQKIVRDLVQKYDIEAIAIGNGTAGRETERFVQALQLPATIRVVMVDEAGASVYSASETARKEFADYDVTVRGAVSIGRRLMDPLAELVKIDPKAIGVGQYQHDVDQTALKQALDDTVMSCVSSVGVELNTASAELLRYVPGLGTALAGAIVDYRNGHGAFTNRKELLQVKRLGAKAFEQAAGFLRIRAALNRSEGENSSSRSALSSHPLDASAVHPERYALVERMAKDCSCTVADLLQNAAMRQRIDLRRYISDSEPNKKDKNAVGLPTLLDIMSELNKPGRDPRAEFKIFQFADVHSIDDLHEGMELGGIVTNVTNFGAFVDIGVHQDGLVHVSQLADKFVSDPAEVVKVRQEVRVRVLEVDAARKRISLSMKGL